MTSEQASSAGSDPGAVDPSRTAVWCCELELSGAGAPTAVTAYAGQPTVRVLVRVHGEPLGYLEVPVPAAGPEPAALAQAARATFGDRLAAHLAAEGLGGATDATSVPPAGPRCPNHVESDQLVSVVVCTRNRSEELAACLERLRGLTHPHVEVLVVDNAPTDGRTRELVEALAGSDGRFRYVLEPRPGLSRARNRGLAEARGSVIAYTDDDVAVDPGWIQGLLRGFLRRTDVGCVTGLVCTADIAGAAEAYFDARASSWSTRCEAQLFDLDGSARDDVLYPYSPGIFGTGANFAFDREMLVGMGGFDEALGAGTRTRGGEDLDIFVRVLRAGRALAYEPAAVVWHHHRADHAALTRQMYGYGTGLSAFLAKCLLHSGTRGEVLRRIPVGLRRMAAIRRDTTERLPDTADRPDGLLLREFLGFATGPVLYVQARRAVRQELAAAGSGLPGAGGRR